MKKTLFFVFCLLVAVSCKISDNLTSHFATGDVEFTAALSSTRTLITQDGNNISTVWLDGDKIGVFSSASQEGNYPYVAAIPDPATPSFAKFTAVSASQSYKSGIGTEYYAYYPYVSDLGNDPKAIAFTLPSSQKFKYSDQLAALYELMPMYSKPYIVSSEEKAVVHFDFKPLLPIVQLNISLSKTPGTTIPVNSLVLSSENPLCGGLKLDITGDTPEITLTELQKSIVLSTENVVLTGSNVVSVYMIALPGTFEDLKLRLYASDLSYCDVTLPEVTFEKGCNYIRDVAFDPESFQDPAPLKVEAASLTCKAGEPLNFTLSGITETVGFYSGEKFHDYEYRDKDRTEPVYDTMTFWHGLSAGKQPNNLKVKLSPDFNGIMNETNILAATWVDVTDKFSLATEIPGDKNPITSDSETYYKYMQCADSLEINAYYTSTKKLYIGFFYHIDAYVATLDNSRTWSILTRLSVGDKYAMSQDNMTLVTGASYSGDSSVPAWLTPKTSAGVPDYPAFRFFSNFKPATERNAYAITNVPIEDTGINYGKDKPFEVKSSTAPLPAQYSYTFAASGVYKTVFLGQRKKLDGSTVETTFEFTITVNE